MKTLNDWFSLSGIQDEFELFQFEMGLNDEYLINNTILCTYRMKNV